MCRARSLENEFCGEEDEWITDLLEVGKGVDGCGEVFAVVGVVAVAVGNPVSVGGLNLENQPQKLNAFNKIKYGGENE